MASPRWRQLRSLAALAVQCALALPPFLVTNCWLHFLGLSGVWRSWLPLNIFSLGGTVWILALLLWPIPLLAVSSAWQRLEPAQLESDTAVTGWALIRGLLLPLARSALALAAVLTFVLALNNFAVPAILQVKVFPAEMWVRFNTSFDTLGALRLSWPLVVGAAALALVFARREVPWPHLETTVSPRLFRQQLGRGWFWFAGLCDASARACSPWACPSCNSFPSTHLDRTAGRAGRRPERHLEFILVRRRLRHRIIALGLAAGCAHWPRRGRSPCNSLNPFNPFNSFTFSSARLASVPHPGGFAGHRPDRAVQPPLARAFYQSAGIVILALVIRYLAPGWNTVAHAVGSVDRDLTDAATLSGATRWQMLRYVHWPQIAPQVAAAWYIVFLLCLWDVESMILVVPPGGETLALRVFNLLHYGHNAQVNALCLTLLALAVAPLADLAGVVRGRVARGPSHARHATRNTSCSPASPRCSPAARPMRPRTRRRSKASSSAASRSSARAAWAWANSTSRARSPWTRRTTSTSWI